jgi:hypothetical protein
MAISRGESVRTLLYQEAIALGKRFAPVAQDGATTLFRRAMGN